MSLKNTLENYPDIDFIEGMSLEDVQKQMIADFESKYKEITGNEMILARADPARLILYSAALQLYQGMQYIDRGAKQSLLKYSYGDYLDNLGALKGIVRNQGEPARTVMRFTLSAVRPETILIPMGTRVTAGGNVYFYTEAESAVSAGSLYEDVPAVCAEKGACGNDYEVGEINTLVDKLPYAAKVGNTEKTTGGADIESDTNLAERIYVAPSSYSVAGPDDAYAYWVRTYNPSITDVKISSPLPGKVDIRFILEDGELPEPEMVADVQAYLESGERRPLTDWVEVGIPELQGYNIEIKYWINESDRNKAAAVQKNVEEAVIGFEYWQKKQIGRDINPSLLSCMVMQAGAKRVEIVEPVFTKVKDTGLAVLEEKEIVYGGIEHD